MPVKCLALGIMAASSSPGQVTSPLPACLLLSEVGVSAVGVRPDTPSALWKGLLRKTLAPFLPSHLQGKAAVYSGLGHRPWVATPFSGCTWFLLQSLA